MSFNAMIPGNEYVGLLVLERICAGFYCGAERSVNALSPLAVLRPSSGTSYHSQTQRGLYSRDTQSTCGAVRGVSGWNRQALLCFQLAFKVRHTLY